MGLPPGFMSAAPESMRHGDGNLDRDRFSDPLQTSGLFPPFMLPRACMGIVCKYFLKYTGDPAAFEAELVSQFPCCASPKEDLKRAFVFWQCFTRCVDEIAEKLGTQELAADMKIASHLLQGQQVRMGMVPEIFQTAGAKQLTPFNN